MKTLYQELKKAGIPIGSHESDLYFKRTAESMKILTQFDLQSKNATCFVNQAHPNTGEVWVDVPFAYDPWWNNRNR